MQLVSEHAWSSIGWVRYHMCLIMLEQCLQKGLLMCETRTGPDVGAVMLPVQGVQG